MAFSKQARRDKIRRRIRRNLAGTAQRPRLSVYRSNKEIYAQIVNDESGETIAAASSREIESNNNKLDASTEVGKMIADRAKGKDVETVTFDRGGYLYHGRVKALADGAREGGLKF